MDRSSDQYSDPNPFGSPNSLSIDYQEASSLSDGSTTRTPTLLEERFLLATSCTKKRAGRRIFRETRHPVYRGVRRRNGDKWVCEVREPNKKSRIWLGTYPIPEMAARAHDVAALALKGKSACLNFADSAWRLPLPVSTNAMDIRRAASEAANLFRPQESDSDEVITTQHIVAVEDPSEACSAEHKTVQKGDSVAYMDEDATFDMPGLLVDMAGGLLLSPPNYARDGSDWELNESNGDLGLWDYM